MGLIDDGQHVIVELGGVVLFVIGVLGYGSAGGIIPIDGVTLSTMQSILAIVLGLYLMGYRKLPKKIVGTVGKLRK